jgi:carboxymethylenebutenolidase
MKQAALALMSLCVCTIALAAQQAPYTPPKNDALPPPDARDDNRAVAQLKDSPRHGEWVDAPMPGGPAIRSWVVYPERANKGPVVIVIHEIYGMTDWVRGVADQLAKEGFIAIAPDLLSGKGPDGGGSDALGSAGVGPAIRAMSVDEVNARIDAVMAYGTSLPSSDGQTGIVGFCWGGQSTLAYAIHQPALGAAVVFYGPPPTKLVDGKQVVDGDQYATIKAPMLNFFAGNDARVTATMADTGAAMTRLGKNYDAHVYDGAAHGFMHLRSDADYNAGRQAWPLAVSFFHAHVK